MGPMLEETKETQGRMRIYRIERKLSLLKSLFLLRQLMLRLTMDTLLVDHVRAPVRPPDSPNVRAFPPDAPIRNLGVTAPTGRCCSACDPAGWQCAEPR